MSGSVEREAHPASAGAARWEQIGRDLAPALDEAAAVVVVGDDAEAAAAVALGAGRAQCHRRRVAIGDLAGEVAPLQSLVTGDDPHGLVDSFLYGVSLNRIARPVDHSGNLFVLPSGSEPVVSEEIFRSARWARLAIGFREVGALLLLVARAGSPGVDALASQLDGVLLVGASTRVPSGAPVLALATAPDVEIIRPPAVVADVAPAPRESVHASPPQKPPVPAPPSSPEPEATTTSAASAASAAAPERPFEPASKRWARRVAEAPPTQVQLPVVEPRSAPRPSAAAATEAESESDGWRPARRRPAWVLPLAAGVVAAVGVGALVTRGGGSRSENGKRAAAVTRDSVAASASGAVAGSAPATGTAAAAAGGSAAAGGAASIPAAPAAPALRLFHPADSARAARFSVQLVAANTIEGAMAKRREAGWLPATAVSPMTLAPDGTQWYRLTVGAYSDLPTAEAYVSTLRARRKLDPASGSIVSVPFAILLDSSVSAEAAPRRVAAYLAKGLPAYGLRQPDGSARIYAGAFESPEQAALLAPRVREAGMTPVVAYRTGRPF